MSTALATIPPQAAALVEERKIRNALAQQLRGATWSKDLSADGVRALAEYCYRRGVDPVAEVEVLGGRPYFTATYYDRIGADLIAAGVVERVEQLHVAADPRLGELVALAEQLAAEGADDPELRAEARNARREQARRLALRIKHAAPEGAAAVVVTRIYVRGLASPIEAANWAGGGVRPKTYNGKAGDPIGDAEPTKTAESRSRRRAWRQLLTSDAIRGLAPRAPALARAVAAEQETRDDGALLAPVLADDMARGAELRASMRPHALAAGDLYADPDDADDAPAPRVGHDEADPLDAENAALDAQLVAEDADAPSVAALPIAAERAPARDPRAEPTDADRGNAQRSLLPDGAAVRRRNAVTEGA